MIIFEDLDIEGFGKIQKFLINLNKIGLNILKAPNGSGKTTIFSAFSWVLSGQTLKRKNNVNTWEKDQPKNYKGTKVHITFIKDGRKYEIIRCDHYKGKVFGAKGKKRLILIEEGNERKDLRNKIQVQQAITDILGYSHDLFVNSVIFGQKLKRIIDETGPNKKKVFEDAFEVTYINEAKKKAALLKEDISDKLHKLEPTVAAGRQKIEDLELQLESTRKAKTKFKDNKETRIDLLKREIKAYKKRIGDPEQLKLTIKYFQDLLKAEENSLQEMGETEKAYIRKEMEIEKLEGNITNATRGIAKLKEAYPLVKSKCPRCNQPLNKELVQQERDSINSEISDFKEKKDNYLFRLSIEKEELQALKDQYASIEAVRANISSNKVKIRELETNLKQQEIAENNIKNLKRNIKAIKREKFVLSLKKMKADLKKITSEIEPLVRQVIDLNREKQTYEWLIKVPLSNSGIKAFIFDYMLGLVNDQLENYEKVIGFNVNFAIDMESSKRDFITTITRDGSIQPYEDLSGGEQQLVDIALAFAIHDVTCIEKPINVLMMDEAFEGLDANNTELVSEMIQFKAKDKALWLVTHLDSFNPSGSRLYQFDKKGISALC